MVRKRSTSTDSDRNVRLKQRETRKKKRVSYREQDFFKQLAAVEALEKTPVLTRRGSRQTDQENVSPNSESPLKKHSRRKTKVESDSEQEGSESEESQGSGSERARSDTFTHHESQSDKESQSEKESEQASQSEKESGSEKQSDSERESGSERASERESEIYISSDSEPSRDLRFKRKRRQSPRKLRQKQSVDYKRQLMPPNFTQILDQETELIERSKTKRSQSPQRNKLNEEEEEEVVVPSRICTLFGNSKMKHSPLNLNEIILAEQSKILNGLDQATRNQFLFDNPQTTQDKLSFDDIAGFDDYIRSLKEMVALPLMYPSIFEQFKIQAPKGVLFHGPPGVGKTMMARCLAASCSTSSRPVAFFMRKGADILNKWVGETEKQLRLLFEQARAFEPSIIFFDEIDGLAPVRSSKQDQIHASVVSTLLALMDGLDNRGQVIVIGATNRIDAIDPALRRPGRFDREFYFGLPNEDARRKIIQHCTKTWEMDPSLVDMIASMTQGFNGADVKALCTEAALQAVRRTFPQIYETSDRLQIEQSQIKVRKRDFMNSLEGMVSSSDRSFQKTGKPLPQHLRPLLQRCYDDVIGIIQRIMPLLKQSRKTNSTLWIHDYLKGLEPRLLIQSDQSMGQNHLANAVIEYIEKDKIYVQTLDLNKLTQNEHEMLSVIGQVFHEIKRHPIVFLYLPLIDTWLPYMTELCRNAFFHLLNECKHQAHFVMATCLGPLKDMETMRLFEIRDHGHRYMYYIPPFSYDSIVNFFVNLLSSTFETKEPKQHYPQLPMAPTIPDQISESEKQVLMKEDENHKRLARQLFSEITSDLKKSFRSLSKLSFCKIDLSKMEDKIHANQYQIPKDLQDDVQEIIDHCPDDEYLRKARRMRDMLDTHISQLPREFVRACWYFMLLRKRDAPDGSPIASDPQSDCQSQASEHQSDKESEDEQSEQGETESQPEQEETAQESEQEETAQESEQEETAQAESRQDRQEREELSQTTLLTQDQILRLSIAFADHCQSQSLDYIEDLGAQVATHLISSNYSFQSLSNILK
ncbi:hypothetical protein EDD86DRAFT_209570 [Gorgonomyces haynaldii]|nr:hypothetical protein EDD86DRAFT_209570 [Gorgonomyces haynaldii]